MGTVFDPAGALGTDGLEGVDGVVGVGTEGDPEGTAAADGVVDEAGAGAPWGAPALTALHWLGGGVWILQAPGRVRAWVWFMANGS